MRFSKRKIFISILLLLFGFLTYHILFGRLFAFSPIIIGFENHKTENATVYYHKGESELNYKTLDSLIVNVEQFHKLNFNKKVKIFVCKTNREFRQYTGSSARFITFFDKTIFMSGKANNERKMYRIHLNTYLKHELSHSLVYQNMSFSKLIRYPQWFLEGLAVYSSNQFGVDGYLTKKETYKKINEGYFAKPKDWGTAFSSKGKSVKECKVKNKYGFIYSEFGCIINDMISIYGKEKFNTFLKQSLQSNNFYILFEKTFNISFSEYLNRFKTRIKATNNVYKSLGDN